MFCVNKLKKGLKKSKYIEKRVCTDLKLSTCKIYTRKI